MKLSVIVPVYNEEKTVLTILQKLLEVKEVYEVVVVNDGSMDNTNKNITKFLKTGKVVGSKKKTSPAKLKKLNISLKIMAVKVVRCA